ncbi:unnamed protein product [Pleuronectes platessa]|uniref:Uncharacterized protein n=1 Tax=Pleuronectes platessa TaxID=8262 RepID=A0A9N7TIK8_PLEPL|nr:unnamed protein product [Pleuronectes platessa]
MTTQTCSVDVSSVDVSSVDVSPALAMTWWLQTNREKQMSLNRRSPQCLLHLRRTHTVMSTRTTSITAVLHVCPFACGTSPQSHIRGGDTSAEAELSDLSSCDPAHLPTPTLLHYGC